MSLHPITTKKSEEPQPRAPWPFVVLFLGTLIVLTVGIPLAVALWRWAVS